jgi:hypothetical protein
MTNADGSFYLLFDEPRMLFVDGLDMAQVPNDSVLSELAIDLSAEIH